MQQPDESPRLHRWAIVVSITSSVGTSLGILFVIGLLLPEIAADLDLSPSEQGWLGSSVLVANVIFCIPVNLFTSRSRPWRTLSLLFLGVGLFTLLQAWSPILAVLIVGRVGLGVLFTATQSPRALILQQWVPKHRLAFVNGVIFAGIDLIMGLIFLTTPYIQDLVNG
ncbi:MAG: MFS transporter, partial [Chloroflexi bacterium]|nr:MFS transporter [Chloroflexota bacterium]